MSTDRPGRSRHAASQARRVSSPDDGNLTARALHDAVGLRLAGVDQRYTPTRRSLVDALFAAGRPLTVPELLVRSPDIPQSSAYRNVTALIEAGVARRVAGTDDHGRFELTESFSEHHHHLVCARCGKVEDVHASPLLERALADAARAAANEQQFEISEHRFDLIGRCRDCR
jgi:Fe2+ or Zn2+ uptake regulation protein